MTHREIMEALIWAVWGGVTGVVIVYLIWYVRGGGR